MGILSHLFFPSHDWFYGVVLSFWTVLFKHAWERKQCDLAVQWGVEGLTRLVEQRRAADFTEGDKIDGGEKTFSNVWRCLLSLLSGISSIGGSGCCDKRSSFLSVSLGP
jgi:hypothetical protein